MKQVLKLFSLLGVLSFFYPVAMFFRNLFFKTDGGIKAFLIALLAAMIGLTVGMVIHRIRIVSISIAYASLILPILAGYIIYLRNEPLRLLLEIPVLFIIYFVGLRTGIYDFKITLSNKKIYFGMSVISACFIAVSFMDASFKHLKTAFYIFAFVFMITSLIIQNQSNLDVAFTRRITDLPEVPKSIRMYNTMIILVLSAVIIVLFNFKGIVVFLINFAKRIVIYIIQGIIWLINIFAPLPTEKIGDSPNNQPDIPPFIEEGTSSIIPTIVASVIAIFIVLFVLYKLIPVIIEKIKKLVSIIVAVLKKFFITYYNQEASEISDYYDEIEIVKPDEPGIKNISKRKSKQKFKREFRKITDPALKVRYIYRFLLSMLVDAGVSIKKADTAREIYIKALKAEAISEIEAIYGPFDRVTTIYEKVRYGDEIPDADDLAEFGD